MGYVIFTGCFCNILFSVLLPEKFSLYGYSRLPIVFSSLLVWINDLCEQILVPVPQYPLYSAAISLFGGSLVPYYLEETANWGLDINNLHESVARAHSQGITVSISLAFSLNKIPTSDIFETLKMYDWMTYRTSPLILRFWHQLTGPTWQLTTKRYFFLTCSTAQLTFCVHTDSLCPNILPYTFASVS